MSAACLLVLSLVVLPMSTAFGESEGSLFEGPVRRAECGSGSRPETGLQGQVPLADRESGRSAQGYSCNLDVVGRYGPAEGFEGAEWQMAWYGHCAYYDTRLSGTQERRGTIVLDVSDPAHPRYSTNLTTAAMQNPWESLKVNQKRGLLAGVFAGDAEGAGFFDVYDVKTDCAHPRLLASVPVNGLAHEGDWAPDGRTYYATGVFYSSLVTAIDVTDPAQPRPITAFAVPPDIHGLGVSADGRRLYLAHVNPDWQTIFVDGRPNATAGNGLGIHDVSQIQDRSRNPQTRLLGTALWSDGQVGQHAIPFTSDDHPYVLFVDEAGRGGARIIDVSNERRPGVLTKLKTEIQMPENLETANRDTRRPPKENNGRLLAFGYDSHYCNLDRSVDPTIVACSEYQSGLRVFDIRDIRRPREIAYFNPGGDGTAAPGGFGGTFSGFTSAQPRIIPERGEIWFTDQDRGFYVVRFTNGTWPFAASLRSVAFEVDDLQAIIERRAFWGSRPDSSCIPIRRSVARAAPTCQDKSRQAVTRVGRYRRATAPDRNSWRSTSSSWMRSRRPASNVGPCPARTGCTRNSYSSISPRSANARGSVTPPTNRPSPGSCLSR